MGWITGLTKVLGTDGNNTTKSCNFTKGETYIIGYWGSNTTTQLGYFPSGLDIGSRSTVTQGNKFAFICAYATSDCSMSFTQVTADGSEELRSLIGIWKVNY